MAGYYPSGFFGGKAEFMVPFITARLPGPAAATQPQTIAPPSYLYVHVGIIFQYFPKSLGDHLDVFLAKLR